MTIMTKLFRRKPKTPKMPMKERTRNIIGASVGAALLVPTMFAGVSAAQAATMHSCYIAAAVPDMHMPWRHGHVFASVDYTWAEEFFLGQVDGIRYFGTTSWDKVGTRPYWINGC